MFGITGLALFLQEDNAWQSTPYPMYENDYVREVVHAIKKFYADTNHPEGYDRSLYTTDEDEKLFYNADFDVLQEEYIYILAKMFFLQKVLSSVTGDGAVSYTTDALSVTGAKEGYKSIQQQLDTLEQERIRVFHKMMARDEG